MCWTFWFEMWQEGRLKNEPPPTPRVPQRRTSSPARVCRATPRCSTGCSRPRGSLQPFLPFLGVAFSILMILRLSLAKVWQSWLLFLAISCDKFAFDMLDEFQLKAQVRSGREASQAWEEVQESKELIVLHMRWGGVPKEKEKGQSQISEHTLRSTN